MNKAEIASYLVSLHTLLEAQSKGVVSVPSTTLGDEYNKYWDQLKSIITKENEDEARNNRNDGNVNESRAHSPRNQSGRGQRVGEHGWLESDPSR